MSFAASPPLRAVLRAWPAALVWALAWLALFALDGRIELAGQALLLVLASSVAALWSPPWLSVALCAAAVLGFNLAFVPPRGSLSVELHQHALLLATMLVVSWIVAWLMARQRRLAARERLHREQAEQLRRFGDALREADDPRVLAPALREALTALGATGVAFLVPADGTAADTAPVDGPAEADERSGLALCLRLAQAMGPGTGRHEDQPALYLPMRGRHAAFGAAVATGWPSPAEAAAALAHAQALCDQMGAALDRAAALHAATLAREAAQAQALRNTLLAAISHDHRTPLATILGAASSLHDQAERLTQAQSKRLAATIVDEATQLARLTDNTLQLARLDSPGLALPLDWESAEDLVGSAMRRIRQRHPGRRVKAHVDAGLPLLRCDAVLLVQLLDNLVDNALKYGGDGPVEILVRELGPRLLMAVRDRGPGVPVALRERIFDSFQRGQPQGSGADAPTRRGAGVGLAVCRAIARAHGGELRHRERRGGGSAFELLIPLPAAPEGVTP